MKEPNQETIQFIRKASEPNIKASQDAYNQTAFCLTRNCPNSNYFTEYENNSGSLVTKTERSQFTFAHTIANKSQLADITENQKLAWIPLRPAETWSTKPIFSFDSPSRVLAFRGFCRKCDNDLFTSIDRPLKKITHQTAFMLAYRSFAYKCWVDEAELNAIRLLTKDSQERTVQSPVEVGDSTKNFIEEKADKYNKRKFSNLVIANIFQDGIEHKQYYRLKTTIFELDSNLDYRYSCAAHLTLDFASHSIKMNWDDCIYDPLVFVHMLKVGNVSNLIISWLDYVPDKFAEGFIDKIHKLNNNGDLPDTFIRYAVINNRGLAMKPSWITSWPDIAKVHLSSPVTKHIYAGAEIPEAPIPTLGWSGSWKITNQTQIEKDTDLHSDLWAHYRIACLDSELNYPSNAQEMGYLIDRYSGLFKSAWDYLDNNQYRDALCAASEMLRIVPRLENADFRQVKKCEAWKTFGSVAEKVRELDIANKSYALAKEFLDADNNEHYYILADLLNRHSNVLGALGLLSESTKLTRESIEIWIKVAQTNSKYNIQLADAYSLLAAALGQQGQHQDALATANKVFELIDRKNMAHLEIYARMKNNLAGLMFETGDIVGSYNMGNDALKAYRQLAVNNSVYARDVKLLEITMQSFDSLYIQLLHALTVKLQK